MKIVEQQMKTLLYKKLRRSLANYNNMSLKRIVFSYHDRNYELLILIDLNNIVWVRNQELLEIFNFSRLSNIIRSYVSVENKANLYHMEHGEIVRFPPRFKQNCLFLNEDGMRQVARRCNTEDKIELELWFLTNVYDVNGHSNGIIIN